MGANDSAMQQFDARAPSQLVSDVAQPVIVQAGGDVQFELLTERRPVPEGELEVSDAPLRVQLPVVDQAASGAAGARMVGNGPLVPIIEGDAEVVESLHASAAGADRVTDAGLAAMVDLAPDVDA